MTREYRQGGDSEITVLTVKAWYLLQSWSLLMKLIWGREHFFSLTENENKNSLSLSFLLTHWAGSRVPWSSTLPLGTFGRLIWHPPIQHGGYLHFSSRILLPNFHHSQERDLWLRVATVLPIALKSFAQTEVRDVKSEQEITFNYNREKVDGVERN